MSRPSCTDVECERAVVRYRDGLGYCLFHPEAEPPVIDPKTGNPVVTTPLRPAKPPTKAARPAGYRAPGRVVEQAPDDGMCQTDGCGRPWRHRGVHTQPKPPKVPRPRTAKPSPDEVAASYGDAADLVQRRAPVEVAPADGRCTSRPGCVKPWRHLGRHTNGFDPAEAARRYLDGEGLFPLAADLHIGVKTLREALAAEGVELRHRGDVIGRRGPAPTPIDPEECQRLYASGVNTTDIARQLHVKTNRVQALLRELGVLRPPGGRPPGAAALNSVRLKLTREESAAVRLRAAQLGQPINHYLRRLVLTDLAVARELNEEISA